MVLWGPGAQAPPVTGTRQSRGISCMDCASARPWKSTGDTAHLSLIKPWVSSGVGHTLAKLCLSMPTWASKVEMEGTFKLPLSLRKIPANPCPPRDALRLAVEWLSHIIYSCYQTAAFALVPGTNESACEFLKSKISVSHNSLDTLCPIGFQSQLFLEMSLLSCAGPQSCGIQCRTRTPHFSGSESDSWDPSLWCVAMQVVGFLVWPYLCLLYPSFLSLLENAVQLVFNSFSSGIVPYIVVVFVYLWEELSLGFLLCQLLGAPLCCGNFGRHVFYMG